MTDVPNRSPSVSTRAMNVVVYLTVSLLYSPFVSGQWFYDRFRDKSFTGNNEVVADAECTGECQNDGKRDQSVSFCRCICTKKDTSGMLCDETGDEFSTIIVVFDNVSIVYDTEDNLWSSDFQAMRMKLAVGLSGNSGKIQSRERLVADEPENRSEIHMVFRIQNMHEQQQLVDDVLVLLNKAGNELNGSVKRANYYIVRDAPPGPWSEKDVESGLTWSVLALFIMIGLPLIDHFSHCFCCCGNNQEKTLEDVDEQPYPDDNGQGTMGYYRDESQVLSDDYDLRPAHHHSP